MYDPQDRALQEFFINSSFVSSADMNAIYRAIWRNLPIDISEQIVLSWKLPPHWMKFLRIQVFIQFRSK